MRAILAASLLAVATPALADQTSATVVSYNPGTHWLTLSDRTVWMLPADTQMPDRLAPGDAVTIVYLSNADNGWQKIIRIDRTNTRPGAGG